MSIREKVEILISRQKLNGYIDLPMEVPLRIHQLEFCKSYKDVALMILNNEFNYDRTKFSPWYYELKRIELTEKGKITKTKQLKLEL